jgi:hypothetical protein
MEEKVYNYNINCCSENELSKDIMSYDNIYISCYNINCDGKYPFIRFILTNSVFDKTLCFPQLPTFKDFEKKELLKYTKIYLFSLLMLENFNDFTENVYFNGFYDYNNNLYLFFDITKLNYQINDIYSNNILWLVLIDEIINHNNMCNMIIDREVVDFFKLNENLCFLKDINDNTYEVPIVSYVSKPENKLNFTYIFGQTTSDKNGIFGPFYYFTNFLNSFKESILLSNNNEANFSKPGIVRFATFIGNTKYFENNENDFLDYSDIKMQRLKDSKLDINMEYLTMRISDHDGKWAEKCDSAYLGNVELDNGVLLEKNILVLKEYNRQIPLSYHFIDIKTFKKDNYKFLIL